jgi:hypothetical protein
MGKNNRMDLSRFRSRGLYIKVVQDRDMFRDPVCAITQCALCTPQNPLHEQFPYWNRRQLEEDI